MLHNGKETVAILLKNNVHKETRLAYYMGSKHVVTHPIIVLLHIPSYGPLQEAAQPSLNCASGSRDMHAES